MMQKTGCKRDFWHPKRKQTVIHLFFVFPNYTVNLLRWSVMSSRPYFFLFLFFPYWRTTVEEMWMKCFTWIFLTWTYHTLQGFNNLSNVHLMRSYLNNVPIYNVSIYLYMQYTLGSSDTYEEQQYINLMSIWDLYLHDKYTVILRIPSLRLN